MVEGIEAGTRLFLIDEDTSATNFMVRDENAGSTRLNSGTAKPGACTLGAVCPSHIPLTRSVGMSI